MPLESVHIMSHESWGVRGGMRGSEGGQEQDQDWRGDMKGNKQEVTNEGQWSVRNIRVIGRSGECQDEEERENKAILSHTICFNPIICEPSKATQSNHQLHPCLMLLLVWLSM